MKDIAFAKAGNVVYGYVNGEVAISGNFSTPIVVTSNSVSFGMLLCCEQFILMIFAGYSGCEDVVQKAYIVTLDILQFFTIALDAAYLHRVKRVYLISLICFLIIRKLSTKHLESIMAA